MTTTQQKQQTNKQTNKNKQKQTMQQANTCIVLIQGNEKLSPRH